MEIADLGGTLVDRQNRYAIRPVDSDFKIGDDDYFELSPQMIRATD
jgi:hypothetical protein